MGAADKLSAKLLPLAESSVHRGEELRGVVAATSAKLYGGKTYVIVVTDKRLVIRPTSPTWEPLGPPISLHQEEIAEYSIDGMAERVLRGPLSAISRGGFVLRMKTLDDRPFELMGWTGEGPFARIGGGEPQSKGVAALREWLESIEMED